MAKTLVLNKIASELRILVIYDHSGPGYVIKQTSQSETNRSIGIGNPTYSTSHYNQHRTLAITEWSKISIQRSITQ